MCLIRPRGQGVQELPDKVQSSMTRKKIDKLFTFPHAFPIEQSSLVPFYSD